MEKEYSRHIQEILEGLPKKPGVYLMKNRKNEIIYVGKAVNLRNRVRQYFQSGKNQPPKLRVMVPQIHDIETILTDSEIEALILENNLIKENHPKYNVLLRDDKTYPYIKVTVNEEYPRLLKTRRILKDGAKYFGPYTNVGALNETLTILRSLYPIRQCNKDVNKLLERKVRPCLNYHIKKCIGPCTGRTNYEAYQEMIQQILLFLEGREDELVKEVQGKMQEAAKELNFERAAKYRDQVQALKEVLQRQKIVSTKEMDQDVIAMAKEGQKSSVQVFFIRQGKLVQRENFILENNFQEKEEEILESFAKQFYSGMNFIPKEVLLEMEIEDQDVIESWLSSRKGEKVLVYVPKIGEKKKLMNMVKENAKRFLDQKILGEKEKESKKEGILAELKERLNLEEIPLRIEAYDISNIQGVESVGSMVVFQETKPNRKEYRRFKIKKVKGPDDYRSMEEVLERRFKRGLMEIKEIQKREVYSHLDELGKFSVFPDVIFIDGGKGQVSVVENVLRELGIQIPVCGMVKDDRHRTRGLIYQGQEFPLERGSVLLRFIAEVQEEVHRFAITHHRSLMKKHQEKSVLDEIPGIGRVKKLALYNHFKSIEKMKKAGEEDFLEVDRISRKDAENLVNHFKNYSD